MGPWERGRPARPGSTGGHADSHRPRVRAGRPRSQAGFAAARLRHNYSRITRDSGDNRPTCNSRWAAPIRWSKTARK